MLKPWISDGCPRNKVETRSMTPGVSMLMYQLYASRQARKARLSDLHLTLELLHHVQKPVVHFWLMHELYLLLA